MVLPRDKPPVPIITVVIPIFLDNMDILLPYNIFMKYLGVLCDWFYVLLLWFRGFYFGAMRLLTSIRPFNQQTISTDMPMEAG
jgi:hypothetical protein